MELALPGYCLFREDRPVQHQGGGVLLYIRDNLQPVRFHPRNTFPEQLWCQVALKDAEVLLVGICYRTPSTNIFPPNHSDLLLKLIEEFSSKPIILMGDFNYPHIDWISKTPLPSASIDSDKFLAMVEDSFLTQHVLIPTRDEAILDLVLTRDEDLVSDIAVCGHLGSSDHSILMWSLNCTQPRTSAAHNHYDYNRANFSAIAEEIRQVNWSLVLEPMSTYDSWNYLRDLLSTLVAKYVPTKANHNGKNKPMWMTYKALRAVKKKHKVFAKYRNRKHPVYQKATKIAKHEIKAARLNFETKLASNIKTDRKSFYAYVNSRRRVQPRLGPLEDSNGKLLHTDPEMAHELNSYFTSVFTQEDTNRPLPDLHFDPTLVDELSDISFNTTDIERLISKLVPGKSPGVDGITPRILREVATAISTPLCIIFRKSLDTGEVPADWRNANVAPIFKKGDKSKPCNYRPISLTSLCSKLLETLIRDAITSHLDKFDLIKSSQHGFRKGRSCLTNLLTFLDAVTQLVDHHHPVDVLYLDFAKAFDRVPHRRLLTKVAHHKITGKFHTWISAWLSNRKQRVSIHQVVSSWQDVVSGVPQGSVLGPLLFLIFINDLDSNLLNLILKFADDTKIFSPVDDPLLCNQLQADLDKLCDWSSKWQMDFNIDKCKVLHIGKFNTQRIYTMSGKQLCAVDQERDLGVTISNTLEVASNCKQAYNKASMNLALMKRTIYTRNHKILVQLYKALVRPHLEYCSPCWSPHYIKDKALLESVQHRFTRLFPNLRILSYPDRLRRLHLWSLEERRHRADLLEVYKLFHGLTSVKPEIFFTLAKDSITRGHSYKLLKQYSNKDTRHYFFTERVVNGWNSLTEEAVSATSINSFKHQLEVLRNSTQMGLFQDTVRLTPVAARLG